MHLVFVRHGEPDYSVDSLTPAGFRVAEMLGSECNDEMYWDKETGRVKFYSNNAGGFLLIMNTATNNVARYNVSRNDRDHVLYCHSTQGNIVYNNTFVIDDGDSYIVPLSTFANNIFFAAGTSTMSVREEWKGVFSNNCYGGNWKELPNDKDAIVADPGISLKSLRPGRNSPCLKGGKVIQDNGGKDYSGKPVPKDIHPDIGAVQR